MQFHMHFAVACEFSSVDDMKTFTIFLGFWLLITVESAPEGFCCLKHRTVTKWDKSVLSYRIYSYPNQYRKSYSDFVFRRAFDLWSQNGDITFIEKNIGPVDINISFDNQMNHAIFRSGEANSFSFPPGNVELSGDMIFNADERWSTDGCKTDLFKRIVHEIGNILGLPKTLRKSSVMNPYKVGYSLQLDDGDREELQKRYGERKSNFRFL